MPCLHPITPGGVYIVASRIKNNDVPSVSSYMKLKAFGTIDFYPHDPSPSNTKRSVYLKKKNYNDILKKITIILFFVLFKKTLLSLCV